MTERAAPRVHKPAAIRRQEIIGAAAAEFAENGLAGTRLEAIATHAGVSHPRVVQMFGSKRALFLEVVAWVFDSVAEAFIATPEPTLVALGDAYRRLLQRDRTVALVMLHAYAAAGDPIVRDEVAARYLTLQHTVTDLTGTDAMGVRTFFATGLLVTVSTALALPGKRTDAQWGGWLLELVTPAVSGRP